MKRLLTALILVLCFGCSTAKIPVQKVADQPAPLPESENEKKYAQMLQDGHKKLLSRYTRESIEKYFDPVIEAYNTQYGNNDKQIYCSRGSKETLFYLLGAVNKKEEAIVISQLWADAFYLKGYASFDLGKIEDAKTNIKKALELSPSNSMYLSELGHIYQVERKWKEAMELYEQAEKDAESFSPEHLKNNELTRALRGRGYTLIELGKLDEAEQIYKKCLEINEKDEKALNELEYIQGLKNSNGH